MGPERRVGFRRVVKHVAARQLDRTFDEAVVHVGVDVDSLDPAADWPELKKARDEILDRICEVRVGSAIAGSLPTSPSQGSGIVRQPPPPRPRRPRRSL